MSGALCRVSACHSCGDACTIPQLQAKELACMLCCDEDDLESCAFGHH